MPRKRLLAPLSCHHTSVEAERAKTLFSDESDCVQEPQLKAGSPLRPEKASGLDSIFGSGGAHSKAVIGGNFWFGNCSGQCDESLLLRQHSGPGHSSTAAFTGQGAAHRDGTVQVKRGAHLEDGFCLSGATERHVSVHTHPWKMTLKP